MRIHDPIWPDRPLRVMTLVTRRYPSDLVQLMEEDRVNWRQAAECWVAVAARLRPYRHHPLTTPVVFQNQTGGCALHWVCGERCELCTLSPAPAGWHWYLPQANTSWTRRPGEIPGPLVAVLLAARPFNPARQWPVLATMCRYGWIRRDSPTTWSYTLDANS